MRAMITTPWRFDRNEMGVSGSPSLKIPRPRESPKRRSMKTWGHLIDHLLA
jgi:hypothetical protein